ncbi:MAG TPA: hypothetical protein VES02_09875 [Dermatophilaceae bacterium]|nr:hypothetical protein [Dermatophilaceae bacterium]
MSLPRANGKTALATMLAAELWAGDASPEVLVIESSLAGLGQTAQGSTAIPQSG